MNRRMILYMVGQMIKLESALLCLPAIVSLIYRERCVAAFLVTIGITLALGFALTLVFKPRTRVIYAKEGFIIVALAWLALSFFGSLPFVISGEIPYFPDAFFETVSGFTTTGSSILRDVEALSRGMLFWRSFTHWVGGMGVLVFIMAIMPTGDRSIHILRAEVPGPVVGKLVPRLKDTAKILYLIYLAMTAITAALLMFGGMSVFESFVHAFGAAGTGGFGIKADSVASYSPYIQWVLTIAMLMFGLNFNLYYLCLIRRFKSALKSRELWCYLGMVMASVALITYNIYPIYHTFSDSLRLSAFQVSSIVTTTGYATADFNAWPDLSKGILFTLMFIGGCAGSTAGGFKLSRVMLLFKMIRRELARMLHPRSVGVIKTDGKRVDDSTINGVGTYLALYTVALFVIFLILSFEPFGILTNFTAAVTCFNNVGPGFGMVGPAGNFADYSALSKFVLSAAMLLGRLEIYPLLLAFSPSTWSKR